MLEKQIELKVCGYAKSKGIYVRKFVSPGHVGVPDRLFITPHRFVFFIEFKRPGGKPTMSQMNEMKAIRDTGTKVWMIDDVQKGIELIDSLMEFECVP